MTRLGRVAIPFLLALVLFALYGFLHGKPKLVDEIKYSRQMLQALLLVASLALIFFVVRAIDAVVFDIIASRQRNVRAPVLLRELVSIVLFVVLLGFAVSSIFTDFRITAFLATGTVVAAVLGLALQETLGNLFAGIALHLEDTFDVGDVVRTGETFGVIEQVRWRGTRIRTFNNNVLIVPNSLLARERLEVFPRRNLNARILQVGVDYSVPPATVIAVLTQAAANVEGVSHELPCFARVGGFAESAVTYEVKYFTDDYAQRDRIDSDIRKAVWYALRRNSISIPFPMRVYQRYQAPEERGHPDPEEIAGELASIDVLSPLPRPALATIAAAARVRVYSRGETIIRRGSVGSSMFIVHEGTVSVRVDDDSELARLGAGDFFGEMALLTGETRTADVVALADVVAIEITKDALQPILHDHPELVAAISAKVMQRRDTLASQRDAGEDEESHHSILSRIRTYFGL